MLMYSSPRSCWRSGDPGFDRVRARLARRCSELHRVRTVHGPFVMISYERYAGPVNGRCEELFPSAPREVAGGPVGHPRSASSRTIDPADYEMTLTGYEHTSLERIFATGICGSTVAARCGADRVDRRRAAVQPDAGGMPPEVKRQRSEERQGPGFVVMPLPRLFRQSACSARRLASATHLWWTTQMIPLAGQREAVCMG